MLLVRKLYLQDQVRFDVGFWDAAGTYSLLLPQGTYSTVVHGAGGAGGQSGNNGNGSNAGTGGAGGAGGVGKRTEATFTIDVPTTVTLHIGKKGLVKDSGGNGGAGDKTGTGAGGNGGGGGEPSYIGTGGTTQIKTYNAWIAPDGSVLYTKTDAVLTPGSTVRVYTESEVDGSSIISFGLLGTVSEDGNSFALDNSLYTRSQPNDWYIENDGYIFALGGGGGGGGGGGASYGRGCPSAGGGGGGGYYRFDNGTITSVPGATGGKNGGNNDGEGSAGGAGNTLDFPLCYSGHAGGGGYSDDDNRSYGGAGNNGGGAGGGGGGAGAGNHSSSRSGAGGGGAGGDYDAGGGGLGTGSRNTYRATSAYNVHTNPTATKDYNGNTQTSGWGVGGGTNANGSDGWIYIKRIS